MTARSRAGARAAVSLRGLPSVDALLRSAPLQALAARVPRAVLGSAARQAVAAARGLSSKERVGVVAFAGDAEWVVPLRPGGAPADVARIVAGIG
ncbi:MAG: hypothetical protein AABZ94_08000, partial [Candidatus Eisenbacteria bacterium]